MSAVTTTVTTSRRGQAWTAEEVEFLLANRSRLSLSQLATALRRDEGGVRVQLNIEIVALKNDGRWQRRQMEKFSRDLLERLHAYMLRREKGLAN